MKNCSTIATVLLFSTAPACFADDWPQWGRDMSKNMATDTESNLPTDWHPGEWIGASDKVDFSTSRGVKWIAKLGSQSYGNPTVAGGRVLLGTNNESPRDARFKGDRSAVYCLDEESGELIWQLNVPKLGTGKVSDWEFLGICSSPTIVGDRVYLVTNKCDIVCLDLDGLADGNDGPFTDESEYIAEPGAGPMTLTATDADIIWTMNMIDGCGVFPHNITSSSVLVTEDKVWASTSNGVDYGHVETPAPFAPSLVCVDRETGELIGEEQSGLSERIFHSNWSSPAYWKSSDGTKELCIFGGPDGWVYGFRPQPIEDEEGFMILDEAFRFDANPKEYRERDGKPIRYATRGGPSEVLATPVIYKDRVYVAIGQDPEHGEGVGQIVCYDLTKEGDTTETGKIWTSQDINRSLSTLAIQNDLVFAADFSGFIYCFDANTGEQYWKHDTLGHIWASPLVADGKVFIGNEDNYLTILLAAKDLVVVNEIDMKSPVYGSCVAANGVLYIQTHTHLFAIAGNEKGTE